ncbi:MAG: tetratricopeptide repeat protein [Pseudomonadota bacterium]|uniref:tetratricopeptide repeat protein n=1 Tax=Sulfuricystis thermophila TaxID=2496847 RepID=UPI001035CA50|nr:hypothetical protein [Sulfuricystis thermophila]MDI6750772.1 hypothetical protein [Rhodocyclaceae bacterium]
MNESLVHKPIYEPFVPPLDDWQPAFFDCHGRLCPVLPSAAHAERYLDFLKHRIARQPADLLAHVRRILLAREYRQKKVTAEALQDLFRVLGDRGAGLRARLLTLCFPLLDSQSLKGLRQSAGASRPLPPAIVIRQANRGIPTSQSEGGNATLLAEALDHLEAGQVDEARSLLEKYLPANPGDVGATRLLLDIYRRARDYSAMTSMRKQIEPLPEAVRPLWEATDVSR